MIAVSGDRLPPNPGAITKNSLLGYRFKWSYYRFTILCARNALDSQPRPISYKIPLPLLFAIGHIYILVPPPRLFKCTDQFNNFVAGGRRPFIFNTERIGVHRLLTEDPGSTPKYHIAPKALLVLVNQLHKKE